MFEAQEESSLVWSADCLAGPGQKATNLPGRRQDPLGKPRWLFSRCSGFPAMFLFPRLLSWLLPRCAAFPAFSPIVLRFPSFPPHFLFASPAKAGAQEPRWCRCHRTDVSAAGSPPVRCSGSCPYSFPPRKRGPRSHGGAVATVRTSAQRVFCRHSVRVHAPIRFPRKSGGLGTAVEPLSRERASAQWALRRRDVRVVLKRKHPPCRGGCGGLMSFWLPSSAPWSLGPGVRRENEG